jgi:hypothetical protein
MWLRYLKLAHTPSCPSNCASRRRYIVSTTRNMQNTERIPSKQKKGSKAKATGSGETHEDGKNSADKAYASTLLLPKTKFPIWIEPNIVQERYQERTTQELYKWQVSQSSVSRSFP